MGPLKLEDYMPDSLKPDEEDRKSGHTTPVQVKEEEEVVTHTTTETNPRQGRQACVAPAEIWLRNDLEEVYVRLPAGTEQRGLARDAEVRHSGGRHHRLRAVSVLLGPGELCDS